MAHADNVDNEKEKKSGEISDSSETRVELDKCLTEMRELKCRNIENYYDNRVQNFTIHGKGAEDLSEQINVGIELKQWQSRINNHDVEIEKMRVKCSELTDQLENADKSKQPRDNRLKALNDKIGELEEDIESKKDDLRKKDKKLRDFAQEKENLEAEITGLSEQDMKKTGEIKALKENVETLKKDVDKLKNENDGARKDDNVPIALLEDDVKKLKDKLKASEDLCEKRQKAIDLMKAKIQVGRAELNDYQESKKKLDECNEKYEFLEKIYFDHKKYIDKFQERLLEQERVLWLPKRDRLVCEDLKTKSNDHERHLGEPENKLQEQKRDHCEAKGGTMNAEKQLRGNNNSRNDAQECDRGLPHWWKRHQEKKEHLVKIRF